MRPQELFHLGYFIKSGNLTRNSYLSRCQCLTMAVGIMTRVSVLDRHGHLKHAGVHMMYNLA